MFAMSMLAVPWVANRCFAAFYRTHIFFALATGILALLHGFGQAGWNRYWPKSVPGAAFWILDLIIRFFSLNCAPCNLLTLRLDARLNLHTRLVCAGWSIAIMVTAQRDRSMSDWQVSSFRSACCDISGAFNSFETW